MRALGALRPETLEALGQLDISFPEQLLTFPGGVAGLASALAERGFSLAEEDIEAIGRYVESHPAPARPERTPPTGLIVDEESHDELPGDT